MSKELGISFEYAIRQFLGDKAHGIAGAERDESSFRNELRSCIPVMRKRIKELDTTTRHKEMLMGEVDTLGDLLKVRKGGTEKEIIVKLFWLISRLFGFDAISGRVYNQPFYHQYFHQFIEDQVSWGKRDYGSVLRGQRLNIITLKKDTYRFLAGKGLPDQLIAEVMNTSDYHIKKIKHNI